jgi:hypothetical protein
MVIKIFILLVFVLSIHVQTFAETVGKETIEKVTYLPIYVTPFYSGPKKQGELPSEVNTGMAEFDKLLKTNNKNDILKVRDLINKDNARVTPMTLFILSARLFDVGEKDEAVFWFYTARDRFRVTQKVGDNIFLATALDTSNSFNELMGPSINGYAFCDIDKQVKTIKAAAAWTKLNPYSTLLLPQIKSPHPDRQKIIDEVVKERINQAAMNEDYFKDPKNKEEIISSRKKNKADEKYCK